ncbi:MAG: hypothetical protein ACP5IJ_01685 [Candidatus Nanoarchaeia archaeon]
MANLICVFCKKKIDEDRLEVFVPGRLWGIKHRWATAHECGHESVFAEGEVSDSRYTTFAYNPKDKTAAAIAKYGFSMWKGKEVFHYLILGLESKEQFKKILAELFAEVDFILNSNIPFAEEKAELLIVDKFGPYREQIKVCSREAKAKKAWQPNLV